jgi:3-hydroxyacyl-[acyl-carrier-protein] dehydratase
MPEKDGTMNIEEIKKYLPHRYPFLFLDRVLQIKENGLIAIKNVTGNEDFFQGHFPGYPVMPGVIQIEAMAQAACLFIFYKHKLQNEPVFFISIDKVKFRGQVVPGDTLRIEIEILRFGGRIARVKGRSFVGDKLVVEAEMAAMAGKGKE